MGSKVGAIKAAAARIGMTAEEYTARMGAGEKRCFACAAWKPVSDFNVDRSRGDGYTARCQACLYVRTAPGPTKRDRATHLANGEAWCRRCEYWQPTASIRGGICRRHEAEINRQRYATSATYRAERRQHAHARQRGVKPIPVVGQEALIEIFGGMCAYCPAPATTWDHIEPISRGGITIPGNVVPACHSCNSSKNARNLDDWLNLTNRTVNDHLLDIISLSYER